MMAGRILIIDDESGTGREFQTTLIKHGYSVPAVAKTGKEALRLASDLEPDVVLLDERLADGGDGIDIARQIQQLRQIPVIFLTSEPGGMPMNRVPGIFPFGYLTRPVSEADLRNAIVNTLRQSGNQQSARLKSETMAQALSSMTQGVVVADLAGNVSWMNREGEEITGWSASEAMGKPMTEVVHRLESESTPTLRRKDGDTIKVEEHTAPLQSESGDLAGLVTVFREAEAQFHLSQPSDLLANIAQSIVDPLLTLDGAGKITHLNPQAAEYYTLGQDFAEEFPQEHFGKVHPHEFDHFNAEREVWHHIRLYPYAEGRLVILRDITENKRNEAEGRRLDKLEGLGFLARGFSHDFNNLLTVLHGSISLAKLDADGNPSLNENLDRAADTATRAQDLVQQLTTFAKGGVPIKGPLRMRDLLEKVIDERRRGNSEITYQLIDDEPNAVVSADPKQLRRVFENLLLNAEQAMGEKGQIYLRSRKDPDACVIEIIDSGGGMAEETLKKALDPFYTTRDHANASGLGLTVCESILQAHQGSLQLYSQFGKGTIATVRLPLAAEEVKLNGSPNGNSNSASTSKKIANGTARILVLEDETLIRRLICATLNKAGYKVFETAEGQATIDTYREASERKEPFDLLIMDLTIEQGMGGVEALSRIQEFDPKAKAIVSSGYSDDPAMANPDEYGFTAVLPKPYKPQELIAVVKELVE